MHQKYVFKEKKICCPDSRWEKPAKLFYGIYEWLLYLEKTILASSNISIDIVDQDQGGIRWISIPSKRKFWWILHYKVIGRLCSLANLFIFEYSKILYIAGTIDLQCSWKLIIGQVAPLSPFPNCMWERLNDFGNKNTRNFFFTGKINSNQGNIF